MKRDLKSEDIKNISRYSHSDPNVNMMRDFVELSNIKGKKLRMGYG